MTATRWARLGAALGLGLGAALGAADAGACDCVFPSEVLPSRASTQVPSNTRVWVYALACSPQLVTEEGTPVAATGSALSLAGRSVIVLTPGAELTVGATYRVTGCPDLLDASFTVTEGPDTTPPPAPGFTLGESRASSDPHDSCGETAYTKLIVATEASLLVLDVAGRAQLDPSAPRGTVVDVHFDPRSPLSLGTTACGTSWDFDRDGDATATRFGAYDLAGNFSGWGEERDVSSPSDGSGCAVPRPVLPARPGLALAGLAPALALAARRRARR